MGQSLLVWLSSSGLPIKGYAIFWLSPASHGQKMTMKALMSSLDTSVQHWIDHTAALMPKWLLKLAVRTTMQFDRIPVWITKRRWSSCWNGVMNQPAEPEFLGKLAWKTRQDAPIHHEYSYFSRSQIWENLKRDTAYKFFTSLNETENSKTKLHHPKKG